MSPTSLSCFAHRQRVAGATRGKLRPPCSGREGHIKTASRQYPFQLVLYPVITYMFWMADGPQARHSRAGACPSTYGVVQEAVTQSKLSNEGGAIVGWHRFKFVACGRRPGGQKRLARYAHGPLSAIKTSKQIIMTFTSNAPYVSNLPLVLRTPATNLNRCHPRSNKRASA